MLNRSCLISLLNRWCFISLLQEKTFITDRSREKSLAESVTTATARDVKETSGLTGVDVATFASKHLGGSVPSEGALGAGTIPDGTSEVHAAGLSAQAVIEKRTHFFSIYLFISSLMILQFLHHRFC